MLYSLFIPYCDYEFINSDIGRYAAVGESYIADNGRWPGMFSLNLMGDPIGYVNSYRGACIIPQADKKSQQVSYRRYPYLQ